MKIDEPKTPYAKRYEPEEDEEEMRMLDAQDLMVDEFDKVRSESASGGGRASRSTKEAEIPGLELGEPEESYGVGIGSGEGGRISRSGSVKGEKQVVVDPEADGEHVPKDHDGNVRHKEFEEMRKKHYEMKDIKGLLGYVLILMAQNVVDVHTNDVCLPGTPSKLRTSWRKKRRRRYLEHREVFPMARNLAGWSETIMLGVHGRPLALRGRCWAHLN